MKFKEFLILQESNLFNPIISEFKLNEKVFKNVVAAGADGTVNYIKKVVMKGGSGNDQMSLSLLDANKNVIGTIPPDKVAQATKTMGISLDKIPTEATKLPDNGLKKIPEIKDLISKPSAPSGDLPTGGVPKTKVPSGTEAAPTGTEAAPTGTEAGVPGGTEGIQEIPSTIFAGISMKALMLGAGGVGLAALIAWLFRRQLINIVWLQKLKNNAKKTARRVDEFLFGDPREIKKFNALRKKISSMNPDEAGKSIQKLKDSVKENRVKSLLVEKDELAMKSGKIEVALKKTKDPVKIKRLKALQKETEDDIQSWDQNFVKTVNESVNTIIDGQTKMLHQRIDELDHLKPSQKTILKNFWNIMMLNLKVEGWKNFKKLKAGESDEIFNSIQAELKEEGEELKKKSDLIKSKTENVPVAPAEILKGFPKVLPGKKYDLEKTDEEGNKMFVEFTEGKMPKEKGQKPSYIAYIYHQKEGSKDFEGKKKATDKQIEGILTHLKDKGKIPDNK